IALVFERLGNHAASFLLRPRRKAADGHRRQASVVETAIAVIAGLVLHAAGRAGQRRQHFFLRLREPSGLDGADEEDVGWSLIFAAKFIDMFAQLARRAGANLVGAEHVRSLHDDDTQPLTLALLAQRLDSLVESWGRHHDPLSHWR